MESKIAEAAIIVLFILIIILSMVIVLGGCNGVTTYLPCRDWPGWDGDCWNMIVPTVGEPFCFEQVGPGVAGAPIDGVYDPNHVKMYRFMYLCTLAEWQENPIRVVEGE